MKKRTRKQAHIITLLICALFLILGIILIIATHFNIIDILGLVAVFALVIVPITYLLIFELFAILWNFDEMEAKEKAHEFLDKDTFIEVVFIPSSRGFENDLFMEMLKNLGCKFYVKLAENDDILLIVKDKNYDNVYNCTISNYVYFDTRFKRKEY